MASMQCDICGERLTMDVSGQFAICDYCGIKHPKARLMKKVSVINGENGKAKEQYDNVSYTEVNQPEPAAAMENISSVGYQAESFVTSEPVNQVYSEPVFVNSVSEQPSAIDIVGQSVSDSVENMNGQQDGLTAAEIAELEKKNNRIEELKVELREFEEIYEANKNKFLGEGLKRKNYSEIKIKEIREKLDELGA